MKNITSKQVTFSLIGVLLFLLLIVFYVALIRPLHSEAASIEKRISGLETEAAIAAVQQTNEETVTEIDTKHLELKVPVQRQIDRLLLAVQEAELVSGSRIEAITFNNYDESIINSAIVPILEENAEDEVPVETDQENKQEDIIENNEQVTAEPPVSTIATDETKPEGLKLITFETAVRAPDFNQLVQFIEELEKLERILRVDGLQFSQLTDEERMLSEADDESITMNIQITTFYFTDESDPLVMTNE